MSVTFLLGPAVSFKAFVHEKKLILAGHFASLGILNIYVKLRFVLQIPVVPATLPTTVTKKNVNDTLYWAKFYIRPIYQVSPDYAEFSGTFYFFANISFKTDIHVSLS